MKQCTLKKEIRFEGTGIHLGVPVEVVVHPADAHTGIRFKRIDSARAEVLPARFSHIGVGELESRQTTLGKGPNQIATIEHLMAAFHGLGVDNAFVEIRGSELPALDGSADAYAKAIREAGLVELAADRHYIRVQSPVHLQSANGVTLAILPSDEFRVSYTLSYTGGDIADQFASFEVTPDTFLTEIAPARTFCLRKEVEALKRMGYGQGANLENTLVYEAGKPIETKLRFPEEAVRHKVLDLIGDLYLTGYPIKGHVIAVRSGHAHNLELVKRLLLSGATEDIPTNGHTTGHGTLETLDIAEIKKIIPHRYPFLWVDRVTNIVPGKSAIGIKQVTKNDYFFAGHFPGHPIMPGVIIIEAMAQVGAVAMMCVPENRQKIAYFMSIDRAKFRKPVLPGDELRMEVEIIRTKARIGQCRGVASVNGNVVCDAEVKFAFVKESNHTGARS